MLLQDQLAVAQKIARNERGSNAAMERHLFEILHTLHTLPIASRRKLFCFLSITSLLAVLTVMVARNVFLVVVAAAAAESN